MSDSARVEKVPHLPDFDPEHAEVILTPEVDQPGYWVGCPTVEYDAALGVYWLTYRQRRPRGHQQLERGWRCAVALSEDGVNFRDVWSVEKTQLSTSSMERFCLVKSGDADYQLYLSYVDPADSRWRIDVLRADHPSAFDITSRRPVLTAAGTGTEGVKDPYLVQAGGETYLFASYAEVGEFSVEQAHRTADIYNVGVTTCPTGLAVRNQDGDFGWKGNVLGVGAGWDRYQARLSSVVALDGAGYLGFYDGSASVQENYEERLGLAVSKDLLSWTSLTPQGPWVTGASATGSVRYLDVVPVDGAWWIYFEATRADGAHELRRSRVPTPPAVEGLT